MEQVIPRRRRRVWPVVVVILILVVILIALMFYEGNRHQRIAAELESRGAIVLFLDFPKNRGRDPT